MKAAGVELIQFSGREILTLMENARRRGVRGGAVYDYMHVCAARKAGALGMKANGSSTQTAISSKWSALRHHPLANRKPTKSEPAPSRPA
jgi:hypothetical protein